MVLDHSGQVRSRELAIRDPARELVVPHAVVSAQELAIRLREVRDDVPVCECERSTRGLSRVLPTDQQHEHRFQSRLSQNTQRTHFMLLPGVIWPNSFAFDRILTYAESDSSGLSVALPK